MEFFNKKEEVLDVQLTEYGKYLLSQGRMKPAFYAFYDDEILYDIASGARPDEVSGAAAGTAENQKDTDRRIRYETPNLKVQANTTGVETRVKQFLKTVETNINKKALSVNSINFADAFENVPQFGQKFFAATDPIGTSDLKSQYDPAWGITLMHNEISSSADYYTVNLTSSAATLNNGVIKEIPQLNITLDYKTFYVEDRTIPEGSEYDILAGVNDQGLNIALEKGYILIDLQEHNTVYEKENFYIEVYLSGSDTGLTLLCPEAENLLLPALEQTVGYFLQIDADADIELDVAKEYGINRKAIIRNEGLTPAPVARRRGPGVRGTGPDGTGERLDVGDSLIDIYGFPFDTGEEEEPCD